MDPRPITLRELKMPIEYELLKDKPYPFSVCPKCGKPFLRGTIQRRKKKWGKPQPYCALICSQCKEIVGHEEP